MVGDNRVVDTQWMIYGAYGYTGELIATEAARRGAKPLLAGRDAERLQRLADELGLPHRACSLGDEERLAETVAGVDLVLHCAGPFSATALPMMRACLANKAHYLDITGEIEVFETAQAFSEQAKAAGIVMCPGVGFDVIPTDCVAATLADALPGATSLILAFDSRSQLSRGTAKTSIEGMGRGGKIRRDGEIVTVPLGGPFTRIDFGEGEKDAVRIPWGDVSTAYHTTGIPNIETYMGIHPAMKGQMRMLRWLRWLLKLPPVQYLAKRRIEKTVAGPPESERIVYTTRVYGQVRTDDGRKKQASLTTANGYTVTVDGSLAVAEHLLASRPDPGSYTPAVLMGPDFVERLPGSSTIEVV